MKVSRADVKVTVLIVAIVTAIIMLIPFHAFLTVWLASIVGHYTLLRLWKELLLVVLFGGLIYLLYKDPKLRWKLISYKLSWLIAGYVFVQLLWGFMALAMHHVTAKALGYGWIVDLRFLVFFLIVWVLTLHRPGFARNWPRLVVWPLAAVAGFGLLQYFVLPHDFLAHFGYKTSTIYPYETINHNMHRLRIMSTLRGANPLGAYLVLALSLVAVLWHQHKRSWHYPLLMLGGLLALLLSFSRSAWIGLAVSLGLLLLVSLRTGRMRRIMLAVLVGAVIAGGAGLLALRHNVAFQDAVFHTDDKSTVATTSNEGHASALKNGLMDSLHEPLGRGPGTAGPASVYNTGHQVRFAENYFIQIAQETGWIGLLLFIAINVVVARALWRRRRQTLALGLFAALMGLTAVNFLSHAWADDTLAYLWWGLAGMAIAVDLRNKGHET